MKEPATDFSPTLNGLLQLTRDHLLSFRLQVGNLLLTDLFAGDPAAYRDRDPHKPQRFAAFLRQHGPQLSEWGLGETVLRQSITVAIAAEGLPGDLLARLNLSQMVSQSRVDDRATRLLLAQAAADNAWSARDVAGAAQAAREGRWIDTDPNTPGLQAPEPTEPESTETKLPAGRVVARVEKTVDALVDLRGMWSSLSAEETRPGHKKRLREAVAQAQAQAQAELAQLAAALGEG
jgi:hypothetical protein